MMRGARIKDHASFRPASDLLPPRSVSRTAWENGGDDCRPTRFAAGRPGVPGRRLVIGVVQPARGTLAVTDEGQVHRGLGERREEEEALEVGPAT